MQITNQYNIEREREQSFQTKLQKNPQSSNNKHSKSKRKLRFLDPRGTRMIHSEQRRETHSIRSIVNPKNLSIFALLFLRHRSIISAIVLVISIVRARLPCSNILPVNSSMKARVCSFEFYFAAIQRDRLKEIYERIRTEGRTTVCVCVCMCVRVCVTSIYGTFTLTHWKYRRSTRLSSRCSPSDFGYTCWEHMLHVQFACLVIADLRRIEKIVMIPRSARAELSIVSLLITRLALAVFEEWIGWFDIDD